MKLLLSFLLFSTSAFSQVSRCGGSTLYISAVTRYVPPSGSDTAWIIHSPIKNAYTFAPGVNEKLFGMNIYSNNSDTIFSMSEGRVVFTGSTKREGKYLIVASDSIHISYFTEEEWFVATGDSIKTGQKIGVATKVTSVNPQYRTAIAVTHTKDERPYTFDQVRSFLNTRLSSNEQHQ